MTAPANHARIRGSDGFPTTWATAYPASAKQASAPSRCSAPAPYAARSLRITGAPEVDRTDPLGVVHAGQCGNDDPRREPVVQGQVHAVDAQREQRVGIAHLAAL